MSFCFLLNFQGVASVRSWWISVGQYLIVLVFSSFWWAGVQPLGFCINRFDYSFIKNLRSNILNLKCLSNLTSFVTGQLAILKFTINLWAYIFFSCTKMALFHNSMFGWLLQMQCASMGFGCEHIDDFYQLIISRGLLTSWAGTLYIF